MEVVEMEAEMAGAAMEVVAMEVVEMEVVARVEETVANMVL